MRLSEKSQSIIEYAILIILVAAGIILGGPYVIRGINAHFKLWEDAVKDSQTETIKQTDISELPPVPNCGDCSRSYWIRPGCCFQCGDTCGNGFCCTERGENMFGNSNYCPGDCGGRCAGVTEAVCQARGEGACCNDGCCSNCYTQAGVHTGCHTWRGQCDNVCSICPNNQCEPGEALVNCCQDCHGNPACGDGFCCSQSGETRPGCQAIDCCFGNNCVVNNTCETWCGETATTCPADCGGISCSAPLCGMCVFQPGCGCDQELILFPPPPHMQYYGCLPVACLSIDCSQFNSQAQCCGPASQGCCRGMYNASGGFLSCQRRTRPCIGPGVATCHCP